MSRDQTNVILLILFLGVRKFVIWYRDYQQHRSNEDAMAPVFNWYTRCVNGTILFINSHNHIVILYGLLCDKSIGVEIMVWHWIDNEAISVLNSLFPIRGTRLKITNQLINHIAAVVGIPFCTKRTWLSNSYSVVEDRDADHDDVIKWKHFPRYWPIVWGIHRSPVNSPHKCQWRGASMFSLNKRLSRLSRRRWLETPSRSLWRHCNVYNQFIGWHNLLNPCSLRLA